MVEFNKVGETQGITYTGGTQTGANTVKKESDKLSEYISGSAEIPEDEAAAKMRRKIEAAKSKIESIANASYSEAEIMKAIGKGDNIEQIFNQLVETGFIKKNDDGTYNIKTLSDIFSKYAEHDTSVDTDINNPHSGINNIKARFEKVGIEFNDKNLKRLIEFAGFDFDKENWAFALYNTIKDSVSDAFSKDSSKEKAVINLDVFDTIKSYEDLTNILDKAKANQQIDDDTVRILKDTAKQFVDSESGAFDKAGFLEFLRNMAGENSLLNKQEVLMDLKKEN